MIEVKKNNPELILEKIEPMIQARKKEDERKKRISNFILDNSKMAQRIDHAVGTIKIGENYFRYYGVKLPETIIKIFKSKDGKSIKKLKTEKVNAIILENGDIISEYSKPEGLNFEFDSVMTLKNNRWQENSINLFCNEIIKNNNSDEYSFKKVFETFKKFYNDSMVFDLNEWYDLNPLWDLKTYFWDLDDKFLIIKHGGISGSAKSKGMKNSANLSFNGKKFLCPTPATFFRYRHHNKATLCIEEAERLFDDSKKKNTGDSELVEYINGSYEKGNSVPRQNDKNINQTDEFDPAGFTRIGSIKPLKGALEKRSAPLNMIMASSKDKRGNVEIPPENDPEYCRARNMAYICGLLNYKKYVTALNTIENKYKMANRQWVVSKPLIALAKCVSPELEMEIGNFLSKLFEIRDSPITENSHNFILAISLIEVSAKTKEDFISIEEIKSKFNVNILSLTDKDYNYNNTKVGILLGDLGFSDYRHLDTLGSKRGLKIDFFKLCEILIRQGFLSIKDILKKVSEVSVCQYSVDKIDKWYSDTFLTPYTIDEKEDDFSDTLTDTYTLKEGLVESKLSTLKKVSEVSRCQKESLEQKGVWSKERLDNYQKEKARELGVILKEKPSSEENGRPISFPNSKLKEKIEVIA